MKYIFRGITVFQYDPITRQIESPKTEHGLNSFNFCQYVPEDYILISDFFRNAHLHATGQIKNEDLKDIEVY
jgi:hypothetical protein